MSVADQVIRNWPELAEIFIYIHFAHFCVFHVHLNLLFYMQNYRHIHNI